MGAPTDDWESGFRALTKFVELKGHAGPAGRVHAFGIDLGGWVARRRIAYWDGTLSAGEADLLDKALDHFRRHEGAEDQQQATEPR